jgi:hypothetical protein
VRKQRRERRAVATLHRGGGLAQERRQSRHRRGRAA